MNAFLKRTYAPGSHVIIRDEEWLVRRVNTGKNQATAVHVLGLSELVRNKEAIFLDSLDKIESLRPEETELVVDDSPRYRKGKLYIEGLLRRTPPTDANLYVGHEGALNYAPYQAIPVHTALSALRPRILIADGVGLGKTVEVGMLLSELIKRGKGNRILVIAIKSMLAQFQQEIWSRFAIPLVRLDSVGLQRVRAKIPANKNPFYYYNRAIISVDTLKNDAQYRSYLEQTRWDVIVIDECHNVANAGSQRNRLATLLARTCESMILTSATPHNGKPSSFANLMTMLEPTSIADPDDYEAEAIDGLFVRRFKKDVDEQVQANFQDRHTDRREISASAAENRVFDSLMATSFSALQRIRLVKELLSSPAAAISTFSNRIDNIERQLAEQALPENAGKTAESLTAEQDTLHTLRTEAEAITLDQFSKYQLLRDLLTELGVTAKPNSPRLIIFSERIKTLGFLQEQLTAALKTKPGVIEQFHAGLADTEQQRIVESFGKQDSPIRILLASDAASEGVNLHYQCHLMIHFDIPWSLITLEQRNGRIDRYGQKHEPHIYYLVTKTRNEQLRGDLYVIDRLIDKENEAHKNIGDAATILKLFDAKEEDKEITKAVANQAVDALFEAEETDFLAMMMGDAATADDGASADYRRNLPTLFNNDIAFAREAFRAIQNDKFQPLADYPDFNEKRSEFTLYAPDDLQRRLEFLPNEAIPKGMAFRLSADRSAVMRSMEDARKEEGKWPDLQLWWELHPIFEWLVDRLLISFGRTQTPLITTTHLPSNHALYLVQGILSNRQSQPVITHWFGIQHDLDQPAMNATVLTLEQVLAVTGIAGDLPNISVAGNALALQKRLPDVVTKAQDVMSKLRQERASVLGDDLRSDKAKLDKWFTDTRTRIAAAKMKASGSREVALNRELDNAKKLYQSRKEWFNNLMTDDKPFIRIAAVFNNNDNNNNDNNDKSAQHEPL